MYAIILAIVVAGLSGLPVMPVFIVGALAMLGTAYILSRSDRLLSVATVYFGAIVLHFVAPEFGLPSWMNFASSDIALYAVSGAVMLLAAAIGIFAPLDPKLLSEDGALQMVREREAELVTSSLMDRLLNRK